MECPKCHGSMAYEKFIGKEEQFKGWRCVNCGEIIDSVIEENRKGIQEKTKEFKNKSRYNKNDDA